MQKISEYLLLVLLVFSIVGCASPLKSDDPATRVRAVAELSDDKELFLIAMNVGVYIGQQRGSYCDVFLTKEQYFNDVRIAAVNRISGADWLLKCATWQDGCVYVDSGLDQGRLEYKGENYYTHDSNVRLQQVLRPGDVVREAAEKRLSEEREFAKLNKVLERFVRNENCGKETPSFRDALLPGGSRVTVGSREDAFVDCYGQIKKDNPLNSVLRRIVMAQNDQCLIRQFLLSTSGYGVSVFPDAISAAVDKLDDSDQAMLKKLFRRVFIGEQNDCRVFNGLALNAYMHILNPEADIVVAALRCSDSRDFKKVLERVASQKVLEVVFCDKELPKIVKKEERTELYCPFDVIRADVNVDVMREYMAFVDDDAVLAKIALTSPLFNARCVAVERMKDDHRLASIAFDALKECPYDTLVAGYDLISNRIDWMNNNEHQSAMKIRRLAISRIGDVEILRKLRNEDANVVIKKAVTEQLCALGYSDVKEIVSAEKYDQNLFSMMAEISAKGDLEKISADARLRGVRLLAASKLGDVPTLETADKEVRKLKLKCPDGHIDIGGFYLGMNIEDAYAMMLSRYTDVKPRLYLDDKVLCISDECGQDLAWANADSGEVHWLTLTPSIVRRIAGFKKGTFGDLERVVESKLGISFSGAMMTKGEVSQRIGNYETVDGETLRYFVSTQGKGEDFRRSVRKAINQRAIDCTPMQGGFGAVLANAFEDAMQEDENSKNASSPRFAPQGSLQLQWTKNAVKCGFGSGGSSADRLNSLNRSASELESIGSELEGAVNQLINLSL